MKTVQIHPRQLSAARLIAAGASNRCTLVLLVLLAAAIVVYYQVSLDGRIWILVLPAALLIGNFLLALATRGILRNNLPLMVFHFALIALVGLAFVGQMSRFQATVELAENETFGGQLENVRQGPWHRYGLSEARFTNLGFRISYHEGVRRDRTVNRIALPSAEGQPELIEIGDHVPLVIGHYRFYTTHNKGFAPVFEWRPRGSSNAVAGSIHLPAYPVNEFTQALEWHPPGSDQRLWTMLVIDEDVLPTDRAFEFRVPRRHRIVIRVGDERHELVPGDAIELADGVLRYRELATWMGYKVDYDWTRPWLLASTLVGLAALFLHYLIKFSLLRGSIAARVALGSG